MSARDDDPTSELLREAVDLARQLATAPRGDWPALKSKAEAFDLRYRQDLDRRGVVRRHRMAPDRSADQWILDIFKSTEAAISREQLLADFISRYGRQRGVETRYNPQGPWLLVIEWVAGEAGPQLAPYQALGIHPQALAAQCAVWLPQAEEDALLQPVLFEGTDLDGYHAPRFGGSPLLDHLLDVAREPRFAGESDYWVSAVALPGPRARTGFGLFVLHPNAGTLEDPIPPPNMRQDQRLLVVLALAWRQLEHQIKSLARLSEQNRREFIQLLAPGLLHHEIGAEMRALYGQARELYGGLRHWAQAEPLRSDLDHMARTAYAVGSHAQRLFAVTDAFNNLDKRAQVEDTTLGEVCERVRLLLRHRLGATAVDLALAPELESLSVHTDAVLLTQAVLNIVNNALNALTEGQTSPPRQVRIAPLPPRSTALRGQDGAERVGMLISNNGPLIPADVVPFIFNRGFTTRSSGHGQGLYLVRMVAHYLGGDAQLAEAQALPAGHTVGFRITTLCHPPAEGAVYVHE